ncbi:12581_t:CDS:10, partial [Entrophospora sp. SA101]
LSESNIESIVINIEELYKKYTRHDVNSNLTNLILNTISSKSTLLDQFVIVYATLIASLYKIIGIDFCAYLVQNLIEEFENFYKKYNNNDLNNFQDLENQGGKECLNLIVLTSELYNFQVISCVLVYDLIKMFISNINELNVELLLKFIKSSGYQLRQDDPLALKEIIQQVQVEVNKKDLKKLGSRTKFMIEKITELKNNRLKQQTAISSVESVLRMKKFLANLNKKMHVQATEPLRVRKWWLVGSSWTANLVDDPSTSTSTIKKNDTKSDDSFNKEFFKLAEQHKMNTEVRKGIFVILMSSEDYIDAYERLMKFNQKESHKREIPRILLYCCGNRLCKSDHSFKITFQYCLWDFLRECGENNVGGLGLIKSSLLNKESESTEKVPLRKLVNYSKLYAFLISGGNLSIMILKTVSFTSLKQRTIIFFQLLFSQIVIFSQQNNDHNKKHNIKVLGNIFIKSISNPSLAKGIMFFLSNFVKKGEILEDQSEKELVEWGCGIIKEIITTNKVKIVEEI